NSDGGRCYHRVPLFRACVRPWNFNGSVTLITPAAKRRKVTAHGVSRGFQAPEKTSARKGAKEDTARSRLLPTEICQVLTSQCFACAEGGKMPFSRRYIAAAP